MDVPILDMLRSTDSFSRDCVALFKEGLKSRELTRLMVIKSHEILKKFSYDKDDHVNANISNAHWLELCIVVMLRDGNKEMALDFWKVYEGFPLMIGKWIKHNDVWFKERGGK